MTNKTEKVELKLVSISKEIHEFVRRLAFERRISMKEVVEDAVRQYYGYKEIKESKEESNEMGNKKAPPD